LIVVDDKLLFAVLGGEARAPLCAGFIDAADRGEVFTNGSWYGLLARALAGSAAHFRGLFTRYRTRRGSGFGSR
jgi:hypothetical protein